MIMSDRRIKRLERVDEGWQAECDCGWEGQIYYESVSHFAYSVANIQLEKHKTICPITIAARKLQENKA
jgi:hypothetical protein